ncbi:MAG: hypothetical protein KDA58_02200 [Planctomycetaceae bacterium]|nr:hypothetical protein [Planctomycetaceae bacterium]
MHPIRVALLTGLCLCTSTLRAEPVYPPSLPYGQQQFTVSSPELLHATSELKPGTVIAQTPPKVTLRYYPGQDYPGHPWSVWGDGTMVGDVYYSAIGDHLAPQGNAFVYRFDLASSVFTQVVNVRETIQMPEGHYTPGKIHSRLDLGGDGWLYFSTHRGSTRVTTDEHHYQGDWILRHHPESGRTEVVAHAPLPRQCLPTSVLDPDRLIFYAGTADGDYKEKRVQFLAYDVKNRNVLYSDDAGPYRAAIFAKSTGKVYFQQAGGRGETLPLVRFDPEHPGAPVATKASVGLRACTIESPDYKVYTVDGDQLWEFDTASETARELGGLIVGNETYIASLDIDPHTWRYLYFVAGAHGGSYRDGSPLVQYDLQTGTRKVICFLHPALTAPTGYTCMGTYGMCVSNDGTQVYITWNGNQGGMERNKLSFNTCALSVIEIPESERQP